MNKAVRAMCPEPPPRQGAGAQEAPEPRGRKSWALGGHRRTEGCIEAQLGEDGASPAGAPHGLGSDGTGVQS